MKVCIYLEDNKYLKIGGVNRAYKNKIKAYELNKLNYTTDPYKKDYQILQIEFPGIKSLRILKKMKKEGKKILISTHITAEDFRETFSFGRLFFPIIKKYLSYFYSHADMLISPSNYTKKLVLDYGVKKPIVAISNGIDPDFIKYGEKKRKKWAKKKMVVGNVAFATKRKGVLTFNRIADTFPNVGFKWVGGVHRNILFNVDKLDRPPNLNFTGYVKDVKDAYSSFDVFLFPSFEENQGIVILEAASFGLPIIIRDIPVYRDWLKNGVNCIKCRNDEDFAKGLKKIIENKKFREKLGRNAIKMAKKHSLKNIGKELKNIYNSC